MNTAVRNFVETYKKKVVPKFSIEDFIRNHNHEIWRKCQKCGAYEDLRKTFYCSECKHKLDPNFK